MQDTLAPCVRALYDGGVQVFTCMRANVVLEDGAYHACRETMEEAYESLRILSSDSSGDQGVRIQTPMYAVETI
jgi:hypothetical protein